ncbi:MAG: L,D-transpeptidase family protein [Patescibacteria group bacterium]|nr:L,D-transpeptidase family protein [Patescibacteria group bacterium]
MAMYHKQLVKHITTRIQAGLSNEDIWNELRADGWADADIKEAFYYVSYPDKLERFSFRRFLHSEVPVEITAIFLFVTILAIAGASYAYSSRAVNYNITLPPNPPAQAIQFQYGEQPALSDPDFFGKVKQQFIDDKADFIEADLSAMKVEVYKSGQLSFEVPIITKGRPGSWWETPAGLYKVNNKEKNHFSGMGHVWMPWSMNFQGNFYIHGETYYPDGTPTSAQFTGGCIRLGTSDAEKVYDAVDIGTPVLVFENSFSSDDFSYNDEVPSVSAPIYLAADIKNNHVFASKNSTEIVPIASITKLVTALIATEYINLDNTATVPASAVVYTSKHRLEAGQKYTVYQLLFPLLMESSNEAAETIARFYGRDAFIKHMNDKAAAIGMTHSHFADPSGASADNTSTAEDLFMLAKYIYNNRSFIFDITSGKIKNSAYGTSGFSNLGNFNDFVDNEYFFGGKNGKTTAAEETNLSVFEFPTGDTKRPVVGIVLKSPDEKQDSGTLIDYVLNHFKEVAYVH